MTLYRFHNEYKEFASAIEDEKWSVVAEKFDEAEIKKMMPTITASAIEKLQVDAVNRHLVKQSKHLETVTAMYGNLMMHLSSASNEMVENDAEFGKVKAAKDAVGLWKIIKKTHATEYTGQNDVLRKLQAQTDFLHIAQGEVETKLGFKNRFVKALENYKDIAKGRIEESDMGWTFFAALHPRQNEEFMQRFKSRSTSCRWEDVFRRHVSKVVRVQPYSSSCCDS